jgi:oxygen-independent coproporphyrinogen-3 oxidase
LKDGLPLNAFSDRTGLPVSAIDKELQIAQDKGLLSNDQGLIKPTDKGFDFLSDVQSLFLPKTDGS